MLRMRPGARPLLALALFTGGLAAGLWLTRAEVPVAEAAPVRTAADVYFSPRGGAEKALVETLLSARAEVLVSMYVFTSRNLGLALKRLHAKGVSVRVLLDRDGNDMRQSQAKELEKVDVPMYYVDLGGSGYDKVKFHHKYAVIDRSVVVTGSYNWTQQADDENHENVVILQGRQLARRFRDNFEQCWEEAKKAAEEAEEKEGEGTPGQ